MSCVLSCALEAIRIVDSSVVGYPAEDPGQIPDCEWKLKDLVRITRGFLPPGLFVSVRRPSADAEGHGTGGRSGAEPGRDTEGIVAVVFHRSKDRDAALGAALKASERLASVGKLQHLKILPVDEDRHLAEVLKEMQLGDIVQAAHSPPEETTLEIHSLKGSCGGAHAEPPADAFGFQAAALRVDQELLARPHGGLLPMAASKQ